MQGISMYGCRENNLKDIDITIPYSQIISFVGVSGSGKSSLAFDTLSAEGKRRYIESLGVSEAYFLSKIKKPDADYFEGLPPAISLTQSRTTKNPRSTVGTLSQLVYYLHVLFSSCGKLPENKENKSTPAMFNLNSPHGCCPECGGVGEITEFDELLIWPDQELSFAGGGLKLGGAKPGTTKYKFMDSFLRQYGCNVDTPIKDYPNELKVALLHGQKKNRQFKIEYPGIIEDSERIYKATKSLKVREDLEHFMKKIPCKTCLGTGCNPDILGITIAGKNINYYMDLPIIDLFSDLNNCLFGDYRDEIWNQMKPKLFNGLQHCIDLGMGYLSMARKTTTLSGGELQRLKMIAQISSEISGVVYVLDEPSAGLHSCDVDKVLKAIKNLNNVGNKNTIVLVEHTVKMLSASDYIVEIGPGAGEQGGKIVAQGTLRDICNNECSLSGKYLSGKVVAGKPNFNTVCEVKEAIRLNKVKVNNWKNVSVNIPLGKMVCVTGVSGSGKTSLVFDALCNSLQNDRNIGLESIEGREKIKKLIMCDQIAIGKSSRSCPVTYMDMYKAIRTLFATQEPARKKKYNESHFSFNTKGGRCEKCSGEGILKVDMGFLPKMTVICDECEGKRFKEDILAVKYKGKSIYDVLEMSITQAKKFFEGEKAILSKLEAMEKVGLGYLKLDQSTSTLSGGESQRLKLAAEIAKTHAEGNLLVFDEPTRGLHFEDVKHLLEIMKTLVEKGNSLIIVEHNLDVIASSDYIIDVGIGAGEQGGQVVGEGTPLQIAQKDTPTGRELKEYFSRLNN